jgi:hypothetical protein
VREKLNSNPVAQAAVIGVLGIVVAFLVFTRVISQGGGGAPPPDPATTPTQSGAAPAAPTTTPATSAPSDSAAAPDAAAPVPGAGAVPPAASPATEAFVVGPGLPKDVVLAYGENKVVVLLIVRGEAADDERLKKVVERLGNRSDVRLFVVNAGDIAEYSRIAQGVDVDRTPALVVLQPRRLAGAGLPQATISYGYRGLASATQAVDDALYKGKENLPYYP